MQQVVNLTATPANHKFLITTDLLGTALKFLRSDDADPALVGLYLCLIYIFLSIIISFFNICPVHIRSRFAFLASASLQTVHFNSRRIIEKQNAGVHIIYVYMKAK